MSNHLEFLKLARPPFDAGPDPVFFFESRAHSEALARLLYFTGDRSMGLAALTGEIGAGKTLTLQVLAKRLRPDLYRQIMIFTTTGSREYVLAEINRQLRGSERGSDGPTDCTSLVLEFQRLLRDKIIALGRHLLIVLDESQFMDEACLDTLKCLTNPLASGVSPVSLILAGQPELKERLRALPQVYQRLGLIYHLGYLTREEVAPYVRHRMAVAQAIHVEVFDAAGLDRLFAFSGGCPRQINRVCKLAVDRACLLQQQTIDADMLKLIIDDFAKQFA